jgi:hypothetical protein
MMKKLCEIFLIAAVMLIEFGTVVAQGPVLPPTIISFTSDLDAISMADAEAGQTTAELSWQVVGLGVGQKVALYTYRLNVWQAIPSANGNPLAASGSMEIAVDHPLNFGPPTYSLAILDAQGQTLDQRILTIPYDALTGSPQIENFTTTVQTLDMAQVANGSARVMVGWRVSNRGPLTNLVFEQVMSTGRTVPVELPRPNLWIPSAGEGILAPVVPDASKVIRLQMRVVDMSDGSTLAQETLPQIDLTGTVATPPTPQPAPTTSSARVLSFEAAPNTVARGGTVTVGWQTSGAISVGVWLLDSSGRLSVAAPNPSATGSWTLTLPDYVSNQASFMIFAQDAAGLQAQASLSVRIVCTTPYFFPTTPDTACPQGEARGVQAAFEVFEHGYMIWRGDTSEIYVLFSDTGEVRRMRDNWHGETITFPDPAPQGLYQPARGFGRVWVDNPDVRTKIGWAVTLEQGYTMSYQYSSDYNPRLYVSWPDGTVIYMLLYGDSGAWGFAY